jgi:photosystem II stability/assembly factor-like uncharacterized protein
MWRAAAFVLAVCGTAWSCGGTSPVSMSSPPPSPIPTPTPSPALIGPEGWRLLAGSPESPNNSRHDDLFFLDERNGWLANTRGQVHRTTDAGETWQQLFQFEGGIFPRCLGFASATKGWVGNINFTAGSARPDSSLFETEDGGRTWSNISARISGPTVVGLCGLRVPERNVVVAVGRWNGPPMFVKSTDGGRSFTSVNVAPLASGLVDLFFFNERDGFAVGGLGVGPSEAEQRASRTVILATNDGGATWQRRYTSESVGQWAWKIQFVTDRVGYVTTEGPVPEGAVLKTTDGGLTWRPMLVAPGVAFEAVGFVSPDRGWVGSFPTLYATNDGGASWRSLQYGFRVNRMRVLNEALLYASGDRVYRWTP